jgi:hypothetical protein
MWQCSRQHDNKDEAKFCGKCGEKRETRASCTACGAKLEPEDVFCTSCGHPRKQEAVPAPMPAPVPVPAAVPEVPPPVPVEPPPPEPAVEPQPPAEEPVTFSFGGAKIEMIDGKSPKAAKPATSARRGGANQMVSAIMGFLLIAAVLGAAFYLITR